MPDEQSILPRTLSLAVHELRTPITVASGYLRMMVKGQLGPVSDLQRQKLEDVEQSLRRISELVAEMSELGKLESGQLGLARQSFDLAALAPQLASDMHEGQDRGVRLEVRHEEPLMVTGDRPRLSKALTALMHSILRERGKPGVIVAECARVADAGSEWAVVAIGDEALLPHLRAGSAGDGFREWSGGTGLALPVARRVIEAHGGTVWSSEHDEHRGTGFRLPLTTGSPDGGAPSGTQG